MPAQRFGVPLATLVDLDVDEVAGVVVGYLRREQGNGRVPNRHNTLNDARIEAYEHGLAHDVQRIVAIKLASAWTWLENHFMLVQHPEQSSGWSTLTEAADQLDVPEYLLDLRATELLARHNLDPELEEQVIRQFRRAAYSDAVFAAMRLVEVRVRRASMLARHDIGRDLMFKAFNPGGPLADPALLASENEGRAQLFAGAMGLIKNEHSHNIVRFEDPLEAAELVLFANTLLRIQRRAETATMPPPQKTDRRLGDARE